MSRNLITLVLLSFVCYALNGQSLSIEKTYEFESIKKNSYLGYVAYNPQDGTTTLSYVENDLTKTTFTDYIFDENLEFVREEQEVFTLGDLFRGDASIDEAGRINDKAKVLTEKYPWLPRKPDSLRSIQIFDHLEEHLRDLFSNIIQGVIN